MKMFEPSNAQEWIGLTFEEEAMLAEATLRYLSGIKFDSDHPNYDLVYDGIVGVRCSASVLVADVFVSFMEALSETSQGILQFEWDGSCEEIEGADEKAIAIARVWIWKKAWENWTRDHLGEFPGNELLYKMDTLTFEDYEIDRAIRYEIKFWDAFKAALTLGMSEDVAFEMATDQSPRGGDKIPECLKPVWVQIEPTVLEEINL